MKFRPGQFLFHAFLTLTIFAVVLVLFSRSSGGELAIGNLILRSQRGTSFPLQYPIIDHTGLASTHVKTEGLASEVRNVVLFIGDGMGIGHVSAAAALLERPGITPAMADTPFVGLVQTWAANTLVTDSASSGTALATAHKTNKKMVGMLPDGSVVRNLFEAAHDHGLKTGVITTTGLVDATTASFTAHVDHRDSYDEILEQMLDSGAAVLFGGDFAREKRAQRNPRYLNLAANLEELGKARGYRVTRDPDDLGTTQLPALAFFPPRAGYAKQHGPPLAVSVLHAVEQLLEGEEGFFLVVESEVTDNLAHDNDIEAVMDGMRELNEAVAEVLRTVAPRGDTLVLVTADHDTGGLSLVDGYYEDGEATVRWASGDHSSQWVPLFAFGPGSEDFTGVMDNTEVALGIARALDLPSFPQLTDFARN
jgi:alkaline phosphatase